jgi:hypothetical protein
VTQHYLITNVQTVTLEVGDGVDMHLHVSAIVLMRDRDTSPRGGVCQIRLFGPDPAWPITNLTVKSIAHEISPIVRPEFPDAIQISYALRVGNGDRRDWHLRIVTDSQDGTPLDVVAYPDGSHITDVWRDLRKKVAEHWSSPNMPLLKWVPADYARSIS